jgi:hypothetical protein
MEVPGGRSAVGVLRILLPFIGFLHILGVMDERTKSILAIEQKIAGETARADGCLRELGRLLLERSQDGRIAIERTAYQKVTDELTRLDAAMRQVDGDVERSSEIDSKVVAENRLNAEVQERLAAIYPNLGRLVAEDERFSAFFSSYKSRIDTLQQKINALNERFAEAGEKGRGNIFAWLGKGAQNFMVKSLLAKTEASRKQAYAEVGAEFIRNRPDRVGNAQADSSEFEALCASAGLLKAEYDERDMRIIALKQEKREILSTFGRGGSANRKKTEIHHRTEQLNRELNELYLRLGKKAATRFALQSLFDDEMERILEDVAHGKEIVKDYEEQTAKLKMSLEIDEERADVEKFTKSIVVQRQRIAAAEEIIAQCEARIVESNKRIADLMQG